MSSAVINIKVPWTRVLFQVWGGIGNMVMALSAIDSIAGSITEGQVMVAVQRPEMLTLLYGREMAGKSVIGSSGGVKAVRKYQPQVVVNTVPSPRLRGGLWSLLSQAEIRISASKYAGLGVNYPVSVSVGHYSQMNFDLLAPMGIQGEAETPVLKIDPVWNQQAEDLLRQLDIAPQDKLVGLHPGAGQARKRWGMGNFAEAGRRLAGRGYRVLILGGSQEKNLASEVAGEIGPRAASVAGRGSLGLCLALIARCHVMLSNDSGLAHCSAALGVPTAVIFGPTDPGKCVPQGPQVAVVRSSQACAPCYRPPGRYLCHAIHPPCLDISVDRAMEEVWRLAGDR